MAEPKLKLTFLGTGSAFTVGEDNYQSNILIEDLASSEKLLFDCGSDIRFSAYELGYNAVDLNSVYISHIHADHTGGMEWLGFSRYFGGIPISNLYISEDIIAPLWRTLGEGMSSLQDQQATLGTYFNVKPINSDRTFEWMGHSFKLEYSRHVFNNGVDLPCYGLSIAINGILFYITADSIGTYDINPQLYEKSDVIFHDCETTPFKSGVHASYMDLVNLPATIKKKMWLYHYNPGDRPDPIKDGFKGFVQKGQIFLF